MVGKRLASLSKREFQNCFFNSPRALTWPTLITPPLGAALLQRNFTLTLPSFVCAYVGPHHLASPSWIGNQHLGCEARTKYSQVKANRSVPPPPSLAGASPRTVGSVGPCPRAPSGGSRAQLRHRVRGAEYASAPSRSSGRRAEGKGTGPGEQSKEQPRGAAGYSTVRALMGRRDCTHESLKIECHARRCMYVCCVRALEPCVSAVCNVCRLCARTCYTRIGRWWGGPCLQCRAESSRRREIGLEQTHYGKQLPGRGSGPAGPAARRLGRKLPGLQVCLDS